MISRQGCVAVDMSTNTLRPVGSNGLFLWIDMYLLYLDDSGSIPNGREKVFVLGGVIVPEEKRFWINKHLDELAAEIDPANPLGVEFHACDIFSGRKDPWKAICEKEKRIDIIKSVLQVCKRENLISLATVIDKDSMRQDDILSRAFEDIVSRFQLFLTMKHKETHQNTHGLIIFDKSSSEKPIQQLAREFRHQGTSFRNITAIQEVPLFVDSRASRAIQLADNIAYAIFREYNARDLTYTDVFRAQFCIDRNSPTSKSYGIYHHNLEHHQCECAACLRSRLFHYQIEVSRGQE